MYQALVVARYVIEYHKRKNSIISNLKLQKVLYFIQAEFLVTKGEVCFREDIEAWNFGPVVPVVYEKYSVYGGAGIPCLSSYSHNSLWVSESDKQLMNNIIDALLGYSSGSLVELTQNQDPWLKSYIPERHEVITNVLIRQYFTEDTKPVD